MLPSDIHWLPLQDREHRVEVKSMKTLNSKSSAEANGQPLTTLANCGVSIIQNDLPLFFSILDVANARKRQNVKRASIQKIAELSSQKGSPIDSEIFRKTSHNGSTTSSFGISPRFKDKSLFESLGIDEVEL
jgi:hypothetical protein